MTAVLSRPADDRASIGDVAANEPAEIAPPPTSAAAPSHGALRAVVMLAGLVLITVAVFANGIQSPFYLDDQKILEKTPTVRTLASAWRTQPTRRIGMLSFALNYRLHGLNVTGFHVTNILIHAAAGLALFALVRGTLRLPTWRDHLGDQADWLALAVAAIWLVHPLQTGAVTYTIQRFESLMGLWFLLCLLFLLLGATRTRAGIWYVGCLLVAILGAQTKEVMAVLPVVAVAFDRIFLSNSWRTLAMRRGWVHAGLLAITGWMFYATRSAFDTTHGGSAGLGLKSVTPWEYLSSQPGVLLHYLRLTVWPDRLCFDYLWPVARSPWEIYPAGLLIVGLLLGTVWALWRRPALGFLGLCWFAILAPTSSVIPIADLAFEHRMYLPLAPLVTLFVVGGANLWQRVASRALLPIERSTECSLERSTNQQASPGSATIRPTASAPTGSALLASPLAIENLATDNSTAVSSTAINSTGVEQSAGEQPANTRLVSAHVVSGAPDSSGSRGRLMPSIAMGLIVVLLSLRTIVRNRDYNDPLRLWNSVLVVNPHNHRAHNQLALQFERQGRLREAERHFREILVSKPDAWWVDIGLGNLRVREGRIDDAVKHFESARRVKAGFALGSANLAKVREQQGRWDEAITLYEEALRRSPESFDFRLALADAYQQTGRTADAERELREILARDPRSAEATRRLGQLDGARRKSPSS